MSLVRQLDPRLKVVDEQRSRGEEGELVRCDGGGRESLIGISQNTNHCQGGTFFFQPMLISFNSGGEALFGTLLTPSYISTFLLLKVKDADHTAAYFSQDHFILTWSFVKYLFQKVLMDKD